MATKFTEVYDRFFDKITDDMYLELTELDTKKDCQSLLINAIPKFEFPKKPLTYELMKNDDEFSYEDDVSLFKEDLSLEEINILASLMLEEWLQRQITSIDNTRQKYYGSSFKLTSQAAHLNALMKLQEQIQTSNKKQQRLYGRRETGADGAIRSRWSVFNTYGN